MKVEQIVHTNLIKASAVDGENKTVCSVLRGFLLRAGADLFFLFVMRGTVARRAWGVPCTIKSGWFIDMIFRQKTFASSWSFIRPL